MATSTPMGLIIPGHVVTAAELNALPRGWLGYVEITGGVAYTTTLTDITGLSVAVTLAAGRRIKVSAHAVLSPGSANVGQNAFIREGSTTLQRADAIVSAVPSSASVELAVILTPTAGVHTYKMSGQAASGSSGTYNAGGTFPAWILVEDIGAA